MGTIHLLATRNHAVVHAGLESVQLDIYYEIRHGRRGRTVYLHCTATNTNKQNKLENNVGHSDIVESTQSQSES